MMANDVVNVYTFFERDYAQADIEHEIAQVVSELRAGRSFGEARTQWKPEEEEPLRFVSAWMPDHSLQEYFVRRFASIDPTALVVNFYSEEFFEPVGTRIAVLEGDKVLTFSAGGSLTDVADEILEKLVGDEIFEFDERMEFAIDVLQSKCFELASGRLLEVLPDRRANLQTYRRMEAVPKVPGVAQIPDPQLI